MKLIKKENLSFTNGYLVDENGNVFNSLWLVNEVNEFFKMAEVVSFIESNREQIEAVMKGIPEFKPIETGCKISVEAKATPKLDAHIKMIEEMFDEVKTVNSADEINDILKEKFSRLSSFIAENTFAWNEGDGTSEEFKVNPLDITADVLIATIAAIVENEEILKAITI